MKKDIKRGLVVVIALLCVTSLCRAQDEDGDDDDEAVVTTEEEAVVEDVVYSSPTPSGPYYFAEHFDDVNQFNKKWVLSEAKKDNIDDEIAKYDGKWEIEGPQKYGLKGDMGLVLKTKAKHAAISSRLERPFKFQQKPLVVQYEVALQEGQECGGAYIKLLSQGKEVADLRQFHDRTPYTIMFGPDKCGNDHKLHFIFRHKNPLNGSFEEKHCKKPKERLEEPFKDKLPHLYTLIVYPDNSFVMKLDHKTINDGNLLEDFTPPVNPPVEIDDPNDKKPADWDEREKIPDPDATKPDDWDEDAPSTIPDPDATMPEDWLEDELEMIPDPNAEKPDDWDADMDGDWEAPLIPNPRCENAAGCGPWKPPQINNPAYKGKWRSPLIDNPNYKGKWKPKRIPNPDFFEDKEPFKMTDIAAVGIELWSMSNMILFDNFIITDDIDVANSWAAESFDLKRRKLDKDGGTLWYRVMKSINFKPGWWALYFVYCTIPIAIYAWYLWKRVAEESLFSRLVTYTNDQPWLWAVYVIVIGLPIVLVLVFCCGGSSTQEKEEQRRAALAKKTDAISPDDEINEEVEPKEQSSPKPTKSKSHLEVPEEEEVAEASGEENEPPKTQENATEGAGDASSSPKKHVTQKE